MRALHSLSVLGVSCSLALGLLGCGGAAGPDPSSARSQGASSAGGERASAACPFDVAAVAHGELARWEGSRVLVTLPAGFVRQRGLQSYLHDCGAQVTFIEVPPSLSASDAEDFWRVANESLARTLSAQGTCGAEQSDVRVCRDAIGPIVTRRVVRPEGRATVIVRGAMDEATARAIAGSARIEGNAPFDPVAATGIWLDAPEGMVLAPISSAGVLEWVDARAQVGAMDAATVMWRFATWVSRHADGSEWTDEEIGEALGRLATRALGITAIDQSAMEIDGDDESGVMVVPGTRGAVPVVLVMAFMRDVHGVWTMVGAAPLSSPEPWLDRFAVQLDSFSIGD